MPVGALLETRVRFSETNQNLASVIIGYVRETPLSWIKMRPTIRIKRGFSLSLGYGSPHQQNLDVFFFSLNVGGFWFNRECCISDRKDGRCSLLRAAVKTVEQIVCGRWRCSRTKPVIGRTEEVVWISRKYSSYIVNVSRSHSIWLLLILQQVYYCIVFARFSNMASFFRKRIAAKVMKLKVLTDDTVC